MLCFLISTCQNYLKSNFKLYLNLKKMKAETQNLVQKLN